MISFLIREGETWITQEHNHYYSKGTPISIQDSDILDKFFEKEILDSMRVCQVCPIKNPDFYGTLKQKGVSALLDFSQMDGITFIKIILIAESKISFNTWLPLLFHECVHVVQYNILTPSKFIIDYVNGWASNEMGYYKIPLEQEAYFLQKKFERLSKVSRTVFLLNMKYEIF